jgi:8-amino-7-oxononanoate synthase
LHAGGSKPRGWPAPPAARFQGSTWNVGEVAAVGRGEPRYKTRVRDFASHLESELDALRSASRLRSCLPLTGASRTSPILAGDTLTCFSSNDYLGLASHPALAAAVRASVAREGFGAGAARLVTGDFAAHRELEAALAAFLDRPAALLFPSGYQTNLGIVTALAGAADLIVSDAANHASLIDGCRLSRATVAIYPHGDAAAAESALARPGPFRRRLLLTESLFSMDGDAAPLTALAAAALAHDAIFVVDEAHALGTLGPSGRGLCALAGVAPDVLIGTLGKAFGASGGFASGPVALRELLVNKARTFVFTTAPPPALAAAAQAALAIITSAEGDERRARLGANLTDLAERLALRPALASSPIVPLLLGSDVRALAVAGQLRAKGFLVPAIRPPTVPEGTARLRITMSADHAPSDIARFAQALTEALA